ncbi:MAG TPA: hypothetical protein DDW50_19730 [Firmicutes bacterium]|nr:hypothetical protein [Bacillota bacterium]
MNRPFFDVQTKPKNPDLNYFAGSYLFENGIFLGGSYNGNSKNNISYISPGFRLSMDDASFIALSCDYLTSDENPKPTDNNEIVGYDVYYKYFVGDKAKLGGEVYFPKDEDTYWWLGLNIKPGDDLIIGAYYETQGDTDYYHGGFTFAPAPLIIDAEIGKTNYEYNNAPITNENYYAVSGMLMLSDSFRFGADYFKYNDFDNDAVHAKLNFGDEKANFILKYQFKNDTYPSVITAAFKVNFGK